jgi:prepilin-type N-terminal cleavage/methylation domain-containing protein
MQRRAAFTLLELMIVITVMGTMAALMAPGIGEFLADTRASSVSEELVRLSRHVRARAQQTGLAHLIVFGGTGNDSGGLGRINVWEGMNNHCRQTPWQQALTGTEANGFAPVDGVDLGHSAYNPVSSGSSPRAGDSNRQVIVLSVRGTPGAPDSGILCYEPSGLSMLGVSATNDAGFAFTLQTTPVTFTVTRTVSGELRGAVREVVFPAGGSARFRY